MNILEQQIHTARAIAAINRDAVRELLTLSTTGLERYMALNAKYFAALQTGDNVQGFVDIHRDYVQRLASGIADDFKHRGNVLRDTAERTVAVLQGNWDQTSDAIEDRVDELGADARSSAEQAERKLHSVVNTTREAIEDAVDGHLEEIYGVGKVYAEELRKAGVISLAQLAAMNTDDLDDENHPLHHLKRRMENDGWIEQAKELLQHA